MEMNLASKSRSNPNTKRSRNRIDIIGGSCPSLVQDNGDQTLGGDENLGDSFGGLGNVSGMGGKKGIRMGFYTIYLRRVHRYMVYMWLGGEIIAWAKTYARNLKKKFMCKF